MFGSKKTSTVVSGSNSVNDQVETIIGKDTLFKGVITSNSAIRIDGQCEGEITTTSDVVIGQTGNAKVQVTARNATVAGMVTGNMDITEKLELTPTAKLQGDIKVGTLIIGEGAIFKGNCQMRREDENRVKEMKFEQPPAKPQA